MREKGFLRLNFINLLVSLVLTVVWILIQILLDSKIQCKVCEPDCTNNYASHLIVKSCVCCASLGDVVLQYLQNIVLPFLIVYIVISFIQFLLPSYNHYSQI
ncbi:MAG: hypothetical protein ABIH72_04165 [archaeon]